MSGDGGRDVVYSALAEARGNGVLGRAGTQRVLSLGGDGGARGAVETRSEYSWCENQLVCEISQSSGVW